MTHEEALEHNLPEKYLLGELHAQSRESFEEHVFECTMCAADVADGAVLLGLARQHFRQVATERTAGTAVAAAIRSLRIKAWPLAVAAFLILLGLAGYQNLLQLPHLRRDLARAEAPTALHELVLAGADSRGAAATPTVTLRRDQSLLLTVDIDADPRYSVYICSLHSAKGAELWRLRVDAADVHDAVPIRVPAQFLEEGIDTLQIQGLLRSNQVTSQTLVIYQFAVQYLQ